MLHYRSKEQAAILSEDLKFQTESGKYPVPPANWEYVVNDGGWERLE
jgi:hypothetical protein